ncbi:SDR family NAD(P)-dependent oxidoreductase [Streptacidiphilus jiangxiensis]|uniref:3-oxoacyl-[acyl-carrier protein] reductase n=1 Tax=Streptacidiphilus jiangxiensis TaxID=235985 RepID=A0A1H7QZF3_STRJI|nr:SDR family NAD(P)-dependent oxidoreductase [Streptacidiphilus jiangxiensis]SEL52687.1 3-oxoacyl-[acyl-carrier protein] reductase [Streptacidiphilus jiangxiensis]
MLRELDGRTALVTGGTRGIGRAVARRLAASGATVVLTGRDAQEAKNAAADVAVESGGTVTGLALDQGDPAQVEAFMTTLAVEHPALDIVIANAGTMGRGGPLQEITTADARTVVEVNLLGTFAVLQGAARIMAPRGGGSIVLLTSLAASTGVAFMAAYAATKGAIATLTLSAAQELGPQGIRVNAIAPGVIETDMTAPFPREALDDIAARAPLGRLGLPEDVAAAALFLAGDEAAYITGHVLAVDGGLQP